jgi:hypothetical protein
MNEHYGDRRSRAVCPSGRSGTSTSVSSARRKQRAALLVVAGAALTGVILARLIDWRSHAHPR